MSKGRDAGGKMRRNFLREDICRLRVFRPSCVGLGISAPVWCVKNHRAPCDTCLLAADESDGVLLNVDVVANGGGALGLLHRTRRLLC